jgi:hypothetical protein
MFDQTFVNGRENAKRPDTIVICSAAADRDDVHLIAIPLIYAEACQMLS